MSVFSLVNLKFYITNQCLSINVQQNWLPRRVMSAWRIAGIIHALERWEVHECGDTVFDIEKVWEASIRHGYLPLKISQ